MNPELKLNKETPVAVIGAGTMGSGIAQVAATSGHPVKLIDTFPEAIEKSRNGLNKILHRQVEKGRMSAGEVEAILGRIEFSSELKSAAGCGLVIEAIIEDVEIKKETFRQLEKACGAEAILASNTSSLSITAIASACQNSSRVLGLHFFNPAPLMPLVEVIPGISTEPEIIVITRNLVDSWGKITVLAKDTPGFIVNRVARPFYGESIRILEEGIADEATIDWAMRELGGFRMGPFELMDLIGNDINLKVTETVFKAFFYDPRYRPSFTQQRLVEAGFLGRKSGRGYYSYDQGNVSRREPLKEKELGERILFRILAMLINEAVDAVFWQVASLEDIDLAMTRGVNYPRGLLRWADEIGLESVLNQLTNLQSEYGEDRYRPSPLLRRMVRNKQRFYV